MPFLFQIRYVAAGNVEETSDIYCFYYVLEDDVTERVRTCLAWCNQCSTVTHAESIESPEVLDADIAGYGDPNSAMYLETSSFLLIPQQDKAEFLALRHKELLQRRHWLLGRVSPPKCLSCGTTNIILLREGKAVETPAGPIYIECIGRSTTAMEWQYYSPEGDRIEYTPPPQAKKSPSGRQWWRFWR